LAKSIRSKNGQKKHGRNKKKPSHVRYNMQDRRAVNKARKAKKEKKKQDRAKGRKHNVLVPQA